MKRIMIVFFATVLVFSFISAEAFAQPVHFTKSAPSIPVTTMDGRETSFQSKVIQILGLDENRDIILFANGLYGTIPLSELQKLLPDLETDNLPNISDYKVFSDFEFGSSVSEMQRALYQFGYLDSVDGSFGNQTMLALKAFQADVGLSANGQADPLVQMLLSSAVQREYSVAGISSFDVIRDRADFDMGPVVESGLLLDYDDISGTGMISNGEELHYDFPGDWDIDRYHFSISFGLQIEERSGKVELSPVMLVDCTCVRRPIMEKVTLKSGASRCVIPVSDLNSSLDVVFSVEHAVFKLDQDCSTLLSSAEESGELKIRIDGKYKSYDLIVPAEKLPAISLIGKTAVEIGK